ncbi:glycogen debranching enzyme GlgX domain protein [Mycobacteroides abscessus]|nr:glycogen debranching enzyme GlgX domain protein [Mycobacteroides abscessus]
MAHPAGEEMTTADWDSGFGKSLAVFLNGDAIPSRTRAASEYPATRSCCASTHTTNHWIS